MLKFNGLTPTTNKTETFKLSSLLEASKFESFLISGNISYKFCLEKCEFEVFTDYLVFGRAWSHRRDVLQAKIDEITQECISLEVSRILAACNGNFLTALESLEGELLAF